ncbi:MAG: hypothetical protein HG439_004580 [candidate division SR1 bacterium]|nr:hypothetical protein [candidate division SR1 bacterium]
MEAKIVRKIASLNTVLFIALVPDELDGNGDIISADEIKKAAYEFMLNLQEKKVNVNHEEDTEIASAHFVESYLTLFDMERGDGVIPQGTWILGIQFDDETYEKIQNEDFVGISIEGLGKYEKL